MKKILITHKRNDAIGDIDTRITPSLKYDEHIEIKWGSNKILNHLKDIYLGLWLSLTTNKEDKILITNGKTVIAHYVGLFLNCKKYMIFYHADKETLAIHKIKGINYKNVMKEYDLVICSAKSTIKTLKKDHFVNPKNLTYCHVSINPDFSNLNLKRNNDFLYVGSCDERKNVKNLILAFNIYTQKYDEGNLLIITKDRINLYNILAELKLKKETEKRIKIGLNFNNKQLNNAYNTCRALIFPTLIEGFGLPLVEAMTCKCPIVTSDLPVHVEITFDTQVYVNPKDPLDICEGMEISRKQDGIEGLKISKKYNKKHLINKINEVF